MSRLFSTGHNTISTASDKGENCKYDDSIHFSRDVCMLKRQSYERIKI